MKKYAKICAVLQLSGKKTRYYSVHVEGNKTNEIENFFLRHEADEQVKEQLDEISDWIDGIANQTGALNTLFRQERKASALPPDNLIRAKQRRQFRIEYQEVNSLRLYLIRFSDQVVFLLNGGVKTNRDPEKCPNVQQYFREAQRIADALDEALRSEYIEYNKNKTDIIFNQNFEIEF